MGVRMDYLILGITALVILVALACRQLWKEFQKSWDDMYVKRERDDSDITNLIPHAMREKGRKRATWKYE